ncbi:hypothetical protein G210_3353 [Candida maltosa Xu316]|uniref:Uncharacterized protein n=1 Tax=Candida maltosa (strain Xu316) TaxID=1245528 RepID=M3J3C3_CANMX|nr:hypothetical protein G210_3353 [Candida maltosa Xu316]
MNQMTRLPKLLNELILVDFIPCPTLTKLPLNLTKLGIIEGSAYLGSTDLSDLPLKKFTYKGNFKINGLRTPKELHLPYSLESLRLIGLNIVDLNGLFELNHLEVLEIIDCPKLVTFFVSKFPQNLKKLVYKFDLIIPNLTYLQNKLLEYFEPSMLVVEGNSIFFKISDDNFRLPEKLRVFKLENIPYVKISNLTNLPELNELTIKKIPGFVSQSKLKISFPSSLYKLTLNNLMIDSINGLHFPEKLTYLDLSHNQLSSIDGANLYELKHLQELNLSRNRFEKFNGDGVIPDCITNLNLQSNLIDTFDFNQDMELRTLKIMIIRDIRKPSDIKFPHKLFHLQMSIQVDKLSDNFQLPNTLQSLSIHNPYYGKVPITNQFFQSLPSKMNLTDLTLLNLHFSKDCHIVMPKSIEKLTLSGNFTQTIINNMNVTECSNLTMFCISGGSVKHFNLGTLPKSITNLELKNMNLKYISGDFNLFHNLRYLNLEQNQITSLILPRSITTLILNKNDLNDLSNLLFLENCHYNLSKIYLEMNPNLDSKVILKIAKLLMKISNNFCGIYLSSNLLFNSNSYLENYDVYSKFIFNTDFIN